MVDAGVKFLKFLPRCRDVELFTQSCLLNNTFPDVRASTDVFNQLCSFVRRHAGYLIAEHPHDIGRLFLRRTVLLRPTRFLRG